MICALQVFNQECVTGRWIDMLGVTSVFPAFQSSCAGPTGEAFESELYKMSLG